MDHLQMPKVVIRSRARGIKKAQTRLRKNEQQNKILANEFEKNPIWNKSKIVELQELLGLKPNQIYKWNWDMQRKLAEHKGNSASITAPDISDHISGRKVSDWTGEMGEVDNIEEFAGCSSNHARHGGGGGMAQSHQDAADKSDDQDYLMSNEDDEQLEVHS